MAKALITDAGAPGALARLANQELSFAQEVDAAFTALQNAKEKWIGDDDVSERALRKAKDAYTESLEHWQKVAKLLLPYDKGIDQSRREGEKVPRADVEEFFQQFNVSLDLAIESYIITLSQEATRIEAPEQFYQAHSDALRSCKVAAIDKAIQDGKLPSWAKIV